MVASIRQWDTDWMDQFKTIMPTNFTNLQVYPSDALGWINKVNLPFGDKVAERAIRNPDQRVQVGKEVTYIDKYATREPQVVDMPAIWDSLRIKEEYYAGDVVNALGHVSDLFLNFNDAIANFIYTGETQEPVSYGLLDAGPGTGLISRPVIVVDPATTGAWDVAGNMIEDIATADAALLAKGFYGERTIIAPPCVKPFLSNVLTSTATPWSTWIQSIAGYRIVFTPHIDAAPTSAAFDFMMVDSTAFDLFMTPLKVRGFFDNNTEEFVWHWKTRAYLLTRPKHDGTEWYKGCVLTAGCTMHT